MKTNRTDKLIASAIAALPYRSPSGGFGARVMAGLTARAPQPWLDAAYKAAGLTVTAWAAALTFASARFIYSNFADIAALIIQPGGVAQALKLTAANASLALPKLFAAAALVSELLAYTAACLPAWYEVASAAVICGAAIAALAGKARPARQTI
jgi:hypothetical protein